MSSVENTLRRFVREESGATMVEYAIMIALIAVVCILAVTAIGTKANTKFNNVNAALT